MNFTRRLGSCSINAATTSSGVANATSGTAKEPQIVLHSQSAESISGKKLRKQLDDAAIPHANRNV